MENTLYYFIKKIGTQIILSLCLTLSAVHLSTGNPLAEQASPEITGELRLWHNITISFTGPATSETAQPNPFTDYRLDVTFKNGDKTYVVPGYYAADGNAAQTSATRGSQWKVHFAPDATGTWTYRASFRKGNNVAVADDALSGASAGYFNGASGSFEVSATNKTGRDHRAKGMLRYVGKHHLRFAGTREYFIKGGADAPENFLAYAGFDGTQDSDGQKDNLIKTWEPHVKDWKAGDPTWKNGQGKGIIGALNYLSAKGMNVFSFLTMNIGGDDKNVFPYLKYNNQPSPQDDHQRFDCSKLDQWEIVFAHADQIGMYLHFKLQENENDQLLDGGRLGTERKLYLRELIARFGHHLALNWNLGEENTQSTQEQKDKGNYIAAIDPYQHPIVIHTYPEQIDKVYKPLLGKVSPLTGVSIQTPYDQVHEKTKKWVAASASAGKPWVVANDEQGSSNRGVPPDTGYQGFSGDGGATQADIRKLTLWGNLMAGGAGVEYYFGYQLPESDLTLQDYRSRDRMWDYTRYALQFFRNHLPFWNMRSADDLLSNATGYCLAQPGKVYVVYLLKGGNVSLNLTGDPQSYTARWYNPRNGQLADNSKTIKGGAKVSLGNPPADTSQDWVVLLEAQEGGAGIVQPVLPLTLVNADTDQPIAGFDPLREGAVINLAKTGSKLNILAQTSSLPGVAKVVFGYNGNENYQVEKKSPYVIGGDNQGDYTPWTPATGTNQLTVTAFSSTGTTLASTKVRFEVVDEDSPQSLTFVLINASTNQPIAGFNPMANNTVVDLATTGTSLNLMAKVGIPGVARVKFSYNGNDNYRTESVQPYAIEGDRSGDFYSWTPDLGNNQVTATAYSAAGEMLASATLQFDVTGSQSASSTDVLKAYPNPAVHTLHVATESNVETDYQLTDHTGNKIQAGKIQAGSQLLQLDVQHLKPGIYYFQMHTREGLVSRKIFVNK